jgi:hypothetical protein
MDPVQTIRGLAEVHSELVVELCQQTRAVSARRRSGAHPELLYGAVVLSVSVSVLPYWPLRSVSVAVTFWRNVSVSPLLVTGAL